MNDIHNNDFRCALTERFLDSDTTVEEERMLATFYRTCVQKGCVPKGESEICGMVLATVKTDDATVLPEALRTEVPVQSHSTALRWLAAACIAVAVVCGAVLAFHENTGKPTFVASNASTSSKSQNVVTDTTAVVVAENEATVIARNSGGERKTEARTMQMPKPSAREVASTANGGQAPSSASEIAMLYDVAIGTFSNATDITIERKGDILLLSAVNTDGKTERYAVAVSDGEEPLLVSL